MEHFIIAQALGAIAILIEILRFQCKKSRLFFYIDPFLSILYMTQFILLGAGAYIIAMISVFRGFCGLALNDNQLKQALKFIIIPCYIGFGLTAANSLIEILPIIATLTSTLAFFSRDNRWLAARLYIINCLIWSLYCIPFEAYMHFANCLLIMISLIIGIYRHEKADWFSLKPAFAKP